MSVVKTFNQITSDKDELFEDILKDHYDKFIYFYSLINEIDTEKTISTMVCTKNDESLEFHLELDNDESLKGLIDRFNKYENDYYDKYFSYIITTEKCGVIIIISCNLKDEDAVFHKRYTSL